MSAIRSPGALCLSGYVMISSAILCGCVSTTPGAFEFASAESRNAQLRLTALMLVDTAQTVTIARNPECLREANPVAVAVFGTAHPSPQRVLITNGLYMTAHWGLGSYLDRKAEAPVDLSVSAEHDLARRERWRLLRGMYRFATALGHGAAVVNNQVKGIRPLSSFDCGRE